MTSSAKSAANRRNAKRSTGPKTPSGRAASSQNASTHGLSSGFSVLPHEDQAAFDQLRATYRAELQPKGASEDFLVDQIVQSQWRLDRTRRFETLALELLLNDGEFDEMNPDAKIVAKLSEKCANITELLQRYAKSAEQSYFRANRELIQARATAKRNEAGEAEAFLQQQIASTPFRHDPFMSGARNEPNPAGPTAGDSLHGPAR